MSSPTAIYYVVPISSTDVVSPSHVINLVSLELKDWSLSLTVSSWVFAILCLIIIGLLALKYGRIKYFIETFDIDQAEIGVGNSKVSFKPNITDRQVAYAIWVELSTRKIGLPIDFDHDVIEEIYNSWYNYFTVTRELIKGIGVSQVRNDSTQKIINLSIEVLNQGLRPHLMKWQARFRTWYDRKLKQFENLPDDQILDPQALQQQFPKYDELKAEMEIVNQHLIKYREKMRKLVFKD